MSFRLNFNQRGDRLELEIHRDQEISFAVPLDQNEDPHQAITNRISNNSEQIMNGCVARCIAMVLNIVFAKKEHIQTEKEYNSKLYPNKTFIETFLKKQFNLLMELPLQAFVLPQHLEDKRETENEIILKQENINQAIQNAEDLLIRPRTLPGYSEADIKVDGKTYPAGKILKYVFLDIMNCDPKSVLYKGSKDITKDWQNYMLSLCNKLIQLREDRNCSRRWGVVLGKIIAYKYLNDLDLPMIDDIQASVLAIADEYVTTILETECKPNFPEYYYAIIMQWCDLSDQTISFDS
ncbi:MAG: hypothetical protein V3W20_14145, partial [Candidatus Neomarinimicrobiota bacterium]